MDPPVKTTRAQSELITVQCCPWEPQADEPPPLLSHEVTNMKFEMKYPDRLLLTSSGQEWHSDIATDS